jgi:hypothetical protein
VPTSLTRSITVAAPADEVAATLAAYDDLASWSRAVDHCSALTDPTSGLGAARRIQTGRFTVVERVVDWDLPRTIAYRIDGLPKPLGEVVNRWTLRPAGATTEVDLTTTVDAGARPPARLVERAATAGLARVSDKLLRDLAAHHAGPSVTSADATTEGAR